MITYQRDDKKEYDEVIKTILRNHNQQFGLSYEFAKSFIYVLDGSLLVGAMHVSYFWEWVSIGDVFYDTIDVLKHLIHYAWKTYKDKALGMKYSTTVHGRLEDFITAGFNLRGVVKLTDKKTYYHVDLMALDDLLIDHYQVLVSDIPNKHYQEVYKTHTKEFNEQHTIENAIEVYDVAVLDGERCIGGIQADVYSDRITINRLAIASNYQGRSIGSTLANLVIDHAKDKKLDYVMLRTCEFQAKGFYEKLGFEQVFERNNSPRGYKSYIMIKRLR